jgi:hypothetical protein
MLKGEREKEEGVKKREKEGEKKKREKDKEETRARKSGEAAPRTGIQDGEENSA